MQPHRLTLTGFRGIRSGLGRDTITVDLVALAGGAQLIAIAGANGRGKTTIMDNLHPYLVMPSRAGADGLGAFSYYEHVYLPESLKELVWVHDGLRFKSEVVIRVNGRTRRTEAFLFEERGGAWSPARLGDGTVSDGKVETYERAVAEILCPPQTFFTSVFSAQGKRPLSALRNAEVKTLLADLLGLDEVQRQGTLAAEVARQLKAGLAVARDGAGRTQQDANQVRQQLERLGDVAAAVREAAQQRSACADRMEAARQQLAALAFEIAPRTGQARQGAFHAALAAVDSGVARITGAAGQSGEVCAGLNTQIATLEVGMHGTTRALDAAMVRSEAFLGVSEHLIELVANCGVETEDTPYIKAAMATAAQVGKLLEDALRAGTIGVAELFDENYKPIPGTEPAQVTARFCELTDRLLPQVQERVLSMSERVVFCIAVDRNGYVPTHNRKYCHPQRPGELAWNTANSRYRRIFNDRTGIASARNRRPFLLQTYRRDMGNGEFVLMKEVAAPIRVDGRHWGGLRLAFKF